MNNLRLIRALPALLAMLLLCGCWIYSVNPLAEREEDTTFDTKLLGTWWVPDTGCSLTVTRFFDEKVYRLEYAAPATKKLDGCLLDPGRSASFEGTLVEIGTNRFLDVQPVDRDVPHHEMTLHSFYRVQKLDPANMALVPLNHDWVQSQIEQEHLNMAGRMRGGENNDDIVITTSTKQLREFLQSYGGSDDAFQAEPKLVFQKKRGI